MKIFYVLTVLFLAGCGNQSSGEKRYSKDSAKSQKYCLNDKPKDTIVDLANQGDVEQQLLLAMIYDAGFCQTPDLKAAELWYSKSANQDYVPAQASLGAFYLSPGYYEGYGHFNIDQSQYWLDKAIEKENSQAMLYKSALYCDNTYDLEDIKACRYWLNEAVKFGNEKARQVLFDLK